MKLTFWGTRGSIAVPGPDTLRFGGNTTCVQLSIDGCPTVIIDAGTGIRALGNLLDLQAGPLEIILLVTHLHWDHILGFPFFEPAYRKDCHIRVGGWPKGFDGLSGVFASNQIDGSFPVYFDQLSARIGKDPDLKPPDFRLGPVRVRTLGLNHPQGCLGFRFGTPNGDLVFITDNELDGTQGEHQERTARFCQGAAVLVHDAQYLPEEMNIFRGRGHSTWQEAVALAKRAGVGRLILTHHDPERTDDKVEALLENATRQAGSALQVQAAHEGMTIVI